MESPRKEFEKGVTVGRKTLGILGTYLGAAFGFVTGLAWNNAVQALINYYFPNKGNSIVIQFAYAVGLTLIVALGTYLVLRVMHRDQKD